MGTVTVRMLAGFLLRVLLPCAITMEWGAWGVQCSGLWGLCRPAGGLRLADLRAAEPAWSAAPLGSLPWIGEAACWEGSGLRKEE